MWLCTNISWTQTSAQAQDPHNQRWGWVNKAEVRVGSGSHVSEAWSFHNGCCQCFNQGDALLTYSFHTSCLQNMNMDLVGISKLVPALAAPPLGRGS